MSERQLEICEDEKRRSDLLIQLATEKKSARYMKAAGGYGNGFVNCSPDGIGYKAMSHKKKNFIDDVKKIIKIYFGLDTETKRLIGTGVSLMQGIGLISIKLIIGIISRSFVFLYSCLYALGMVVCRIIYIKCQSGDERKKNKGYLLITGIMFFTAIVFDIYLLVRQSSVARVEHYHPIIVIGFGIFILFSYFLTIKGLFEARMQKNLILIALRLVGFSGMLMNLVLMQRLILGCINVTEEVAQLVNLYFGFSCGGAMVSVAICMLIYYVYQRRKSQ